MREQMQPSDPSPATDSFPPDRPTQRKLARAARDAFASPLNAFVRDALEKALAGQALPHLGPPGVLGSHAAVGTEIDPHALEQAARALGWRLAFPRVCEGPLEYRLAGRDDLRPGYKHIPEPSDTAGLIRPDVLLVPLLAADRLGNRLGQGGGHYDRTLAALRVAGPVLAIGLCWDMQVLEKIHAASWDQPLDAVATPTAFHLVAGPARRTA